MQDRPYNTLTWTSTSGVAPAQCHAEEGRQAVATAHGTEIEWILDVVGDGQSVLVQCDGDVSAHVIKCLEDRLGKMVRQVVGGLGTGQQGGARTPASIIGRLLESMSERLDQAHCTQDPSVVVMRHLDLMTWTANEQPRHELNDVVFWLTEYSEVPKVAFWNPVNTLPRVLEDLFTHHISLQIFSREILWKLISSNEARKLSPNPENFTLAAQLRLYQYLSGTNVVDVRRILRGMLDQNYKDHDDAGVPESLKYIQDHTSASTGQPVVDGGNVTGYEELRERIEREVLFPFRRRNNALDTTELAQADVLIPRGVILYGPPGTGKTEWAKRLAMELGATLMFIHGPELKHRFVGETEAAIRRIFARARRSAPSLIVIDELDAMTPSREDSTSNFEASMVAQFLSEMDGLRKDEAVLVVGTTNRIDAVEGAFKRPSRFGVQIEVGYPTASDREKILESYNGNLDIELSKESIKWLVEETGKVLNPQREKDKQQYHDAYVAQRLGDFYDEAGPELHRELKNRFNLTQPARFSGDHLRGICLYLLRESLYRQDTALGKPPGISEIVNDEKLLSDALVTIRAGSEAHDDDDCTGSSGGSSPSDAPEGGRF